MFGRQLRSLAGLSIKKQCTHSNYATSLRKSKVKLDYTNKVPAIINNALKCYKYPLQSSGKGKPNVHTLPYTHLTDGIAKL